MAETPAASRLWHRLLWFVGLWLAGVAMVGTVSLLLRAVLM